MHEEDTHNECKSIKRVTKNGRVISYIMSPVPKLEPALPRRKKHPDLAYRHHEFLVADGDKGDFNSNDRARVRDACTYTQAINSPLVFSFRKGTSLDNSIDVLCHHCFLLLKALLYSISQKLIPTQKIYLYILWSMIPLEASSCQLFTGLYTEQPLYSTNTGLVVCGKSHYLAGA